MCHRPALPPQCYPLEVFLSPDWNNNRVSSFLERADLVLPAAPCRRGTESRGREWCTRQVEPLLKRVSPLDPAFARQREELLRAAAEEQEESDDDDEVEESPVGISLALPVSRKGATAQSEGGML